MDEFRAGGVVKAGEPIILDGGCIFPNTMGACIEGRCDHEDHAEISFSKILTMDDEQLKEFLSKILRPMGLIPMEAVRD